MTLRARLLLGYGYLVLLVLLVAGSATIGFFDLSGGIERALDQNVQGIRASTRMLEALERQDSATLTLLMKSGDAREDLAEAEETFKTALETARSNNSNPEEAELLDEIERHYGSYRSVRRDLLSTPSDSPMSAYESETFPAFQRVKSDVLDLLDRNYQAMIDSEKRARSLATSYGTWLGFIVVVALLSLVLLTRGLQTRVLERLTDMQQVAQAVGRGETQRRARVEQRDELGLVGEQFNEALDREMEIRGRMQGRVNELHQVIAGLLAQGDEGRALLSLDGELVASTFADEKDEVILEAARDWIEAKGRDQLECPNPTSEDTSGELTSLERPCRIELVVTPGSREVGWLISPVE